MARKVLQWVAVIVLVGFVAAPVVQAATGSFSSTSGSVPAVYGNNTATSGYGWGVKGQTASATGRGIEGYASSNASTAHVGLLGTVRGGSSSPSVAEISGLQGTALGTNGWNNGVFGIGATGNTKSIGVRGYASNGFGGILEGPTGLFGISTSVGGAAVEGWNENGPGPSFGTGAGVLGVLSDNDLGVTGHFITGGSNVGGTCSIPTDASVSSATCSFQNAWPMSGSTPIVILTPQGDPGGYFWAELINNGTNFTGIKAHRSVSTGNGAVTFGFFIVGFDTSLAPQYSTRMARQRDAMAK